MLAEELVGGGASVLLMVSQVQGEAPPEQQQPHRPVSAVGQGVPTFLLVALAVVGLLA